MTTADGGYATLDFGGVARGFTAWGDWWNFSKLNVTNSADGSKGMQLSGNHCVLEQMNFYNNGNSGLQVSGSSADDKSLWPSYNTIPQLHLHEQRRPRHGGRRRLCRQDHHRRGQRV